MTLRTRGGRAVCAAVAVVSVTTAALAGTASTANAAPAPVSSVVLHSAATRATHAQVDVSQHVLPLASTLKVSARRSTIASGAHVRSAVVRFGDRTKPVRLRSLRSVVSHRYARPGSYSVTLDLTDSRGHHQSSSSRVLVQHRAGIVARPETVIEGPTAVVSATTPADGLSTLVVLAAGAPRPAQGGEIVIDPGSPELPDGFLGRVSSIVINADNTATVSAIAGALSDAYSSFSTTFASAAVAGATDIGDDGSAVASHAQRAHAVSASDVAFKCTANGAHNLSAKADFTDTTITGSVDVASSSAHLTITSNPVFRFSAGFSGSASCAIDGSFVLSVKAPIAPPLVLTVTPVIRVTASGSVTAQATWAPHLSMSIDHSSSGTTYPATFSSHVDASETGSAKITFFAGIEAELSVATVAGLRATVGPELDATATAKVTSSGESACVKITAFVHAEAEAFATLWKYTKTQKLFDVNYAPVTLYDQCAPPGGGGSGTVTGGGSGGSGSGFTAGGGSTSTGSGGSGGTTQPSGPAPPCASFISDQTIPDGTLIAPGESFTKIWRLRNCGSASWSGSTAVLSSGSSFGVGSFIPPSAASGSTVDVSVSLTAPSTIGHYRATYQLQNAGGTDVHYFYADINVGSGASGNGGSGHANGDYNGDGKTDFTTYNASSGEWRPYINNPGGNPGYQWSTWGGPGFVPVPGDYNGDGRTDLTIYDIAGQEWRPYINNPGGDPGYVWTQWGGTSPIPIAGDFNGDGKADFTVYEPSTGTWKVYINTSGDPGWGWGHLGGPGWWPVPCDYNGDGRTDFGVYNPDTGEWKVGLNTPTGGSSQTDVMWGPPGFVPVPGDYNGDGRCDFTIYNPATGEWRPYINNPGSDDHGYPWVTWGGPGFVPVPADINGDGKTDFTIYNPSTGEWRPYINGSNPGYVWTTWGGQPGDWPAVAANTVSWWQTFFPPSLSLGVTTNDLAASLTATSSSVVLGTATTTWVLGDGTTASGPSVDHLYAKAGTYSVTATAVDPMGGTTVRTIQVTVSAPVAPAPAPATTGSPPPTTPVAASGSLPARTLGSIVPATKQLALKIKLGSLPRGATAVFSGTGVTVLSLRSLGHGYWRIVVRVASGSVVTIRSLVVKHGRARIRYVPRAARL